MPRLDPEELVYAAATEDLPPLIPVIAQDMRTGEVLMMGWSDREALERTMTEGRLWFFSRSRRRLWMKGETSGNVLRVESLQPDCDRDALLALVRPDGAACHTGARACFGSPPTVRALADVIDERLSRGPEAEADPSYTTRLGRDRNLRLKKLGEEATELALACADTDRGADGATSRDASGAIPRFADDTRARVAAEAADLFYHAIVACAAAGVGIESIMEELESRLDR